MDKGELDSAALKARHSTIMTVSMVAGCALLLTWLMYDLVTLIASAGTASLRILISAIVLPILVFAIFKGIHIARKEFKVHRDLVRERDRLFDLITISKVNIISYDDLPLDLGDGLYFCAPPGFFPAESRPLEKFVLNALQNLVQGKTYAGAKGPKFENIVRNFKIQERDDLALHHVGYLHNGAIWSKSVRTSYSPIFTQHVGVSDVISIWNVLAYLERTKPKNERELHSALGLIRERLYKASLAVNFGFRVIDNKTVDLHIQAGCFSTYHVRTDRLHDHLKYLETTFGN